MIFESDVADSRVSLILAILLIKKIIDKAGNFGIA